MQVRLLGGKIPRSRAWQPIPVFLPGEPHGQSSLAGYSPWGRKESDMTESDLALTQATAMDRLCVSCSVVSDCLGPRGLYPSRFLCP